MKHKIKPIQLIRTIIQIIAFLTVPALFVTVFSAIGGIVAALIGGTFAFSEYLGSIMFVLGIFTVTLIWGRFFCGFICSFGAMQDLLHAVGRLIPWKIKVSETADKWMKKLKYAVLLFVVIGVWGCSVTGDSVWSPWTVFGIYTSVSAWSSLRYFATLGGVLLILIMIGSLFIERFFCKYLCPLGALFSLTARFRFYPLKRQSSKCGSCKLCAAKCPMSVPRSELDEVSSGECINCMKCTEICPKQNITTDTIPAISGTLAVTAIAVLSYAGILNGMPDIPETGEPSAEITADTESSGLFPDGTYTGNGRGFLGDINVTVCVGSGVITDITVNSYQDDKEFFSRAQSGIIAAVLQTQSTDVATVSGATYSSNGLIAAIKDALGEETAVTTTAHETETTRRRKETTTESQTTETTPETFAQESASADAYADGVYAGSGTGLRGQTNVAVTVENGEITDITVTSYQDDQQFFVRAESGMITSILQAQSVDVDTVSGATFSSNSIKEAVANALGIAYTNPNSSMQNGHGGHHH